MVMRLRSITQNARVIVNENGPRPVLLEVTISVGKSSSTMYIDKSTLKDCAALYLEVRF